MGISLALEPALDIKAARGLAVALIARASSQTETVFGVAQLCRQTGALDEARALLESLVQVEAASGRAVALLEALNGRAPHERGTHTLPAPFVRRLEFLDPVQREALFTGLTEALPRFKKAGVASDHAATERYAKAERAATALYELGALRDAFLAPMRALLHTSIYPLFGIDPDAVSGIELQATCYSDGAFFTAHTDSDLKRTNGRALSFVYYLHSQPKAFRGGDLILFDSDPRAETYTPNAYTRIAPVDNSLIVFPSATVHEVQTVSLPNAPPTDARLTLNGWVRLAAPQPS